MELLAEMLPAVRSIHEHIRDAVVAATERSATEELARVVADGEGDTIFAIDRISEEMFVELFEREIAVQKPIVLIAEGLAGGKVVLPRGTREQDAQWRIIADPIDGTRCLMYQKRSGWILTGIAPNRGDSLWAIRGAGAFAQRYNRITGDRRPLPLRPSTASGIGDGFCSIARFFSGGRDVLAAIDDEIAEAATGPQRQPGKAYCFEDQYLSTGGQLYELMMGHDRYLADLRPLLVESLTKGLCCHPYDLCTELIARECGIEMTDAFGGILNAPLNLEADVCWAGFANAGIRRLVEPLLLDALRSRGFSSLTIL
jgi:hypothetical protein